MTSQELYCEECGAANPPTARFCQHCAMPLPVTQTTGSLPEQTLLAGRFQLVSRIGQGGMGAVYKAEDTKFDDRPVAVKEMSKAGLPPSRVAEAEASFEHEANLLSKLIHPNLPRIYEYFTENDRSYLVMDFIEGETLEDYLDKHNGGPLPIEQVITWAEQLCDVLSYLHNHQPPIIFRDLKPANVMIGESGHIFLIDFGIARIFKPGQSHDTVALGSPGYAAPEQYGKAQSSPRTDIYSLGALIHHLLTGLDPSERPFFFRPANEVNPNISSRLSALLQQMLEMESDKRPASAEDVLKALRADDSTTMLVGSQSFTVANLPTGEDRLLEEAHKLYGQKRLAEAEQIYTQALQINNKNAVAWQGKGLTQGLRARHATALESFDKALQLDPKLVIAWNGKGTALNALHRNREAQVAFENALRLEPTNADAWNGKGAVLNAIGLPEQALTAFDAAVRYNPQMAQAWTNKGLVLRRQKRYRDALQAFDSALAIDRTSATAWSGKGSVLHELGRSQEALDAYTQACNYNSALVSAWNGKGTVLYDMGRNKDALSAFQEALNLDKNYAPAYYGMGNVLYAQHKQTRALEMFDKAVRTDPRFAKAWKRRGNILNDMGERHRALESYDRALTLDPTLVAAWTDKGSLLNQLERYPEALDAYNRALKLNQKLPQAWNGMGNTFYHLRNYSQALRAYENALQLNPQMASAWHNKSLVLKELGRSQEALEAAEQAIKLAPNDPDNWLRKAEALKRMGRSHRGDARDAEAKALQLRGAQ
ncbi:MAG TPA: tetratricopeptide repeat protein [Ktedonobacteraceae bacterium]|nr:tetratricopeptide repeat protein [Ktedonobacteraceae bacterium]